MLRRYSNIEYFFNLDADTALELIAKAVESERDDRIFRQWVAQLPAMAFSGTAMSFEEYKDRVTGANIDFRSTADIMADLDEAEKELQVGGDA